MDTDELAERARIGNGRLAGRHAHSSGFTAHASSEAPNDAFGDPGFLRGQYALIRKLGEGGHAVVYLAMRTGESHDAPSIGVAPFSLPGLVAIKTLTPPALQREQIARLFEYEAQVALWATEHPHPSIVRAHAFGYTQSVPVRRPYLVLDYVGGVMVRDRMRSGPLPLIAAIDLTISLAGALDHLHRLGIIHGDVKPENFVLHEDRVTLIDYGLARPFLNAHALPAPPVVIVRGGTPWYMAPEVVEGASEPDPRGDVYSLGVCLYEFIAGQAPYRGRSPTALRLAQRTGAYTRLARLFADIPVRSEKIIRELDDLLAHAIAFDRASRFSMEPFQQSLQAIRMQIQREVGDRTIYGPVPTRS
jgi:serine/threonine-protein kinase